LSSILNYYLFYSDNSDIQQYNFIYYTGLYPLLLPLLSISNRVWNDIMKYSWKKCLDSSPMEYQSENSENLPNNIQIVTNYAFGILNNSVWKIKLNMELPFDKSDICSDKEITYDYLNIYLSYSCMNTIRALFDEVIQTVLKIESFDELKISTTQRKYNLSQDLIKLEIEVNNDRTKLQFFKKNDVWNLIDTKEINGLILGMRLFNNNNIVILTTIGLFIYTFNQSSRSISLTYFYSIYYPNHEKIIFKDIKIRYSSQTTYRMYQDKLKHNYEKVFSKSTLPLPNYDSFKLNDEWISYVKNNKECLSKYGIDFLTFAIKEHKLELIVDIYKQCMDYFKQDLENNRMFLTIITSTMPLLNDYYPEFILNFSLETIMIIDSSSYIINHQEYYDNLHLYSFLQCPQIINSDSWWPKYDARTWRRLNDTQPIIPTMYISYIIIDTIAYLYYFTMYLIDILLLAYFTINITSKFPTIIFMNPYIKFVNYPQNYNWFLEFIRPQSSPFVKTINKDIYKTWNGEALINFKWNTYGKYYYAIIWIAFMSFLGCFTAVATIPQNHLNENDKKGLLISSITLGFIHLSFEVRQFIYNPIKWFHNYWNFFGKTSNIFHNTYLNLLLKYI
jgi:hypothetical protein